MKTQLTTEALTELTKPVAYAYSRFSTPGQADGDSKRRQESLVKKWKHYEKYEIKHLHDAGISAFQGANRTIGQFGGFLHSLRAGALGPAPILLVENLDRISREEIEQAQMLFLELIGLGATIVTLHNQKEYRRGMNLYDILAALLEMDIAHQYSVRLSDRVRTSLRQNKESGGIVHNRSQCPLWLILDEDLTFFTPIPERVVLVQRMFLMAAAGLGPDAIARTFNVEQIPVWTHRKVKPPKAWSGDFIWNVLYGRAVLGEYEGRSRYFGAPVVDEEIWQAVNDRVKRQAQGRGRGVVKETNLLSGLVESGLDGSRMVLRQSGVMDRLSGTYIWHKYLVSNETRAGRGKHRTRYQPVEDRILEVLQSINPALLDNTVAETRNDAQERAVLISRHLEGLKRQIDKYRKIFKDEVDPPITLMKDLRQLEGEHKAAKVALDEANRQAAKVAALPSVAGFDLARPEHRKAVRAEIAQWCQKITLYPDHLIIWFSPRRGLRVPFTGKLVASEVNLDHDATEAAYLLEELPAPDEVPAAA